MSDLTLDGLVTLARNQGAQVVIRYPAPSPSIVIYHTGKVSFPPVVRIHGKAIPVTLVHVADRRELDECRPKVTWSGCWD